MYDVILAAERRVFVPQGVRTMRTMRDDALDAIPVERADVLFGKHPEVELVARPPGHVTRAPLLRPEHREPHARASHDPDQCARNLLQPGIDRSRAADPVQDLDGRRILDLRHHPNFFHVSTPGIPVMARVAAIPGSPISPDPSLRWLRDTT